MNIEDFLAIVRENNDPRSPGKGMTLTLEQLLRLKALAEDSGAEMRVRIRDEDEQ